MGEHHSAQQAEPLAQPDRDQERDGLQQARGEEHHADHGERRAEPGGEPVGDERLNDEPAAEGVHGEQAAQPVDNRAGPLDGTVPRLGWLRRRWRLD